MIGIACPWCDHEVTLQPQPLAVGHIVCPACRTQVDLATGPAGAVDRPDGHEDELPQAA